MNLKKQRGRARLAKSHIEIVAQTCGISISQCICIHIVISVYPNWISTTVLLFLEGDVSIASIMVLVFWNLTLAPDVS